LVVDHHGLLVRQVKLGIAVEDVHASGSQELTTLGVFGFAAAARRIQHHLRIDAAFVRSDDRLQNRRVREDKHLDPQRLGCMVDRIQQRTRGIVGKHN